MIPDKAFEMNGNPSRWVRRFAPLIAPGGRVLDLACGSGRHSLFLAAAGFRVEAVDRDAVAIAALAALEPIDRNISVNPRGDAGDALAEIERIAKGEQ